MAPLYFVESGGEGGDEVVGVLAADREADGAGGYVLRGKFLGCHLRVGCGIRMDYEALHVGHVGKEGEYFEAVDKFHGLLRGAVELNGEYRSAATGVQAAIQVVVGMRRHGGMVHLLYFGMMREKIHDFKRVLHVPLHAQRQGLQSLQKQKRR